MWWFYLFLFVSAHRCVQFISISESLFYFSGSCGLQVRTWSIMCCVFHWKVTPITIFFFFYLEGLPESQSTKGTNDKIIVLVLGRCLDTNWLNCLILQRRKMKPRSIRWLNKIIRNRGKAGPRYTIPVLQWILKWANGRNRNRSQMVMWYK